MKSCKRSTTPLACGSSGSQKCQSTRNWPHNAANSSLGRPPWPWTPTWRSHTRSTFGSPRRSAGWSWPVSAGLGCGGVSGLLARLANLPRAIHGALKRPWPWREQRTNLAHVVIDDRLATIKAQRHDQLTDPLARQLGIGREQPMDLLLERIELRSRRLPAIRRWLIAVDCSTDRVAMQPRAPTPASPFTRFRGPRGRRRKRRMAPEDRSGS